MRHCLLGGQLTLDDCAAQTLQIDSGTVIAQFQHQQPGLVGDTQADQPFGWLARQQALLRSFDTVIDGIAQQMDQGRFELFQHVAVNLGFFAFDFQADLLAQGTPQITHHALLPHQDIGERPHATSQGSVVEQLRALACLPAKLVEFGGLFAEQVLGLGQHLPGIDQGLLGFMADTRDLEVLIERIHSPQVGALHAFKALQGHQKGLEALGFDQGFTRQVEQAVQALGRDPQDPLAAFGQALGTPRRLRCCLDRDLNLWLNHRLRGPLGHSWRGHQQQLRHIKLGRRHPRTGRRRVQQLIHVCHIAVNVLRRDGIAGGGDAHQQIGALQQRVNMLALQVQAAFLGTDQAVFHDMGHAHAGIHADNPRRPLQGMGRPHAGFQLVGLGRVALQRQQAFVEHLGLGLGLQAEQLKQRGVAHLLGGHVRLRVIALSSCSSSSKRRLRVFHCSTPRVYLALACSPDSDAALRSPSAIL